MAAKLSLVVILSAFACWAWAEEVIPDAYGVSTGLAGLLIALSDKWMAARNSRGSDAAGPRFPARGAPLSLPRGSGRSGR